MIQEFCKPATLDEALKLKKDHPEYRYLAGGTEINATGYLGKKKTDIPGLISLAKLDLSDIKKEDDILTIGATVTLQELIDSEVIKDEPFIMLKKAASNIANRNIRNMATVAGNIGACKSCSDMIPVLLVMEGKLEIYSEEGKKEEISVEEYIKEGKVKLITKITVPARKDFYIALSRYTRASNDLALINICLGMELKDGICKEARLAIGGVAASPIRIKETEEFLKDKKLVGELADFAPKLREHVEKHVYPIDDLRGKAWFKKEMAGGLVIEAFYKAADKGGIAL